MCWQKIFWFKRELVLFKYTYFSKKRFFELPKFVVAKIYTEELDKRNPILSPT